MTFCKPAFFLKQNSKFPIDAILYFLGKFWHNDRRPKTIKFMLSTRLPCFQFALVGNCYRWPGFFKESNHDTSRNNRSVPNSGRLPGSRISEPQVSSIHNQAQTDGQILLRRPAGCYQKRPFGFLFYQLDRLCELRKTATKTYR